MTASLRQVTPSWRATYLVERPSVYKVHKQSENKLLALAVAEYFVVFGFFIKNDLRHYLREFVLLFILRHTANQTAIPPQCTCRTKDMEAQSILQVDSRNEYTIGGAQPHTHFANCNTDKIVLELTTLVQSIEK